MSRVKGLYAVTPDLADTALLSSKVRQVLAGGARLVQYRNKTADRNLRREQAAVLHRVCADAGATLIINDDVELALEIDAHGVHVGIDDAAISTARARLGDSKIIGASCYSDLARARCAAADGADYIAFGSFFASSVKPNAVRAPVALLASARNIGVPVTAIGGITLDNAAQLIHAGADALAVISALFSVPDVEAAAREFCELFAQANA
jgi:thiamine-phosphate pyrophosphorylase